MIRSKLGRTLLGAVLTVAFTTVALAPASAASTPVITWQGSIADGASYVFGQVPAGPTCTATEDLVPVSCVVTGYSTAVGSHTLTATAIASDLVTTAVEYRSYTVTAWKLKGFYKPVRMNTINKVKAGSTVPLKFKIYQGTTKKKSTNAVASLTAQRYDCTTLAPIGAAVPIASTHKGYRLKYRNGAYHQNWKTPKLPKSAKAKGKPTSVGACYTVTLTAKDASTLTANFRLK
ncbi:MAG: PxKF domain-containing protein [Propionicimonas sp.]|nr:PxKF domain-containing protein [Propionicimonas sp.]